MIKVLEILPAWVLVLVVALSWLCIRTILTTRTLSLLILKLEQGVK